MLANIPYMEHLGYGCVQRWQKKLWPVPSLFHHLCFRQTHILISSICGGKTNSNRDLYRSEWGYNMMSCDNDVMFPHDMRCLNMSIKGIPIPPERSAIQDGHHVRSPQQQWLSRHLLFFSFLAVDVGQYAVKTLLFGWLLGRHKETILFHGDKPHCLFFTDCAGFLRASVRALKQPHVVYQCTVASVCLAFWKGQVSRYRGSRKYKDHKASRMNGSLT